MRIRDLELESELIKIGTRIRQTSKARISQAYTQISEPRLKHNHLSITQSLQRSVQIQDHSEGISAQDQSADHSRKDQCSEQQITAEIKVFYLSLEALITLFVFYVFFTYLIYCYLRGVSCCYLEGFQSLHVLGKNQTKSALHTY